MSLLQELEILLQDPMIAGGIIVILAGALIYQKKRSNKSAMEVISPEKMQDRLKAMFTDPAFSDGAKISDIVKIQATNTVSRTLGMAIRAKEHDVQVKILKENDKGNAEYQTEKVDGTTYMILKGSKKWILNIKKLMFALSPTFLKRKMSQTYDVPHTHISADDKQIWFINKPHFVEFNDVKRVLTQRGMGRIQELSFSKVHENYLEASQNIPEQYATLNNRISGMIKIENIKSENIKNYMESKNRSSKKDRMND